MPAGVVLDTSFLITLADPARAHHGTARQYWRHFGEQGLPVFLPTVVVSEFCIRQEIPPDILRRCVVLPFNWDDAIQAAAWWQKCHDHLAAMKARGILHPPDEKFLVQARAKVAAAVAAEMEAGDDAAEGEAAAEMDAGGAAGVGALSPEAPVPRPWWARLFGKN